MHIVDCKVHDTRLPDMYLITLEVYFMADIFVAFVKSILCLLPIVPENYFYLIYMRVEALL